jgi:hypothetical protein
MDEVKDQEKEKRRINEGSLGISVKGPYMVVRQKACSLPGRDKCAGKDGQHWLCHSIVV